MIQLQEFLLKAADLPALPAVAMKVAKETESSNANASSIADLIAHDQSLTVRVLRLANSPFFGLSRKVSELREAVVVLGLNNVRRVSLMASTYIWLNRMAQVSGGCPTSVWHQNLALACVAEEVARSAVGKFEEDVFTAGLIADVGITALCAATQVEYSEVIDFSVQYEISLAGAETKLIGLNHIEAGAALAELWGFPETLANAIKFHHHPNRVTPASPLVDCLHVADHLMGELGIGLGQDGVRSVLEFSALERLAIDPVTLESILVRAMERYSKAEGELNGELAA